MSAIILIQDIDMPPTEPTVAGGVFRCIKTGELYQVAGEDENGDPLWRFLSMEEADAVDEAEWTPFDSYANYADNARKDAA